MLKLKYLYENFDLARKCMELYDYDKDSAEEMMQYFRISSNAIYPFRYRLEKDKVCFLRLSPIDEKKPSEARRSHKDLLEEIAERIQKYGASDIVWKEVSAVCEELSQLSVSASNYGIIHYDFEADNVFYNEQDESFHVIDFDDAICCWYALDVVRALDALEEIDGNLTMEEKKQCFLSGYQSVTALTQEQIQSLSLMRRLVHLQEYATLLHVLSEEIQDMPDWMTMLCEKLNNKLEWLEKSMERTEK